MSGIGEWLSKLMPRLASTGVELKRAEETRMLVEEANLWSNGERINLETALMLFLEGKSLEGVQGPIGGIQGTSFGAVSKAKTMKFIVFVMTAMMFRPSCCHVSDISHKLAASTHVHMYGSMMWCKRGRGDGGM